MSDAAVKILLMGEGGSGKTTTACNLAKLDDFAPLLLLQAEVGGNPVKGLVRAGRVIKVPCQSVETIREIVALLERGPVRLVKPEFGLPYLEAADPADLTDRGQLDPGCFYPKTIVLDTISALKDCVLDAEQQLSQRRQQGKRRGGDGPTADGDGLFRRKNYGVNSAKDWYSGTRVKLGGLLRLLERASHMGIAVLITTSPKAVVDYSQKGPDGNPLITEYLQPDLPAGEQYGKLSRNLYLWARHAWMLERDGGHHFALTRELSARQVEPHPVADTPEAWAAAEAEVARWTWAKKFGAWAKASPDDQLRPVIDAILPQCYPDPDLATFFATENLALELIAQGLDPKDDPQGFLVRLREAGGRVLLE